MLSFVLLHTMALNLPVCFVLFFLIDFVCVRAFLYSVQPPQSTHYCYLSRNFTLQMITLILANTNIIVSGMFPMKINNNI